MAETFTYDLVSFLRVLYRQRRMIVLGTLATAVLSVVAALVWPETWRANARVMESTPQYKENLRLIPKPFDVIAYQSLLIDDSLFLELQTTLVWLGRSVHLLKEDPALAALKRHHADQAVDMTEIEFIGQTNADLIGSLLGLDAGDSESDEQFYLHILTTMNFDGLEVLIDTDVETWEDITIFDFHRMMSAETSITKETNLETIYSPLIRVSGEGWSAESAQMITNVWLQLFQRKAERLAQEQISREIARVTQYASKIAGELATTIEAIAEIGGQARLDQLRAEAASLNVTLYGMAPVFEETREKSEAFDLENSDEAFLTEKHSRNERTTFVQSETYEEALIPRYQKLLNELPPSEHASNPELNQLEERIETVRNELAILTKAIQAHQVAMSQHEFVLQQQLNDNNLITNLVSEANNLSTYRSNDFSFADVSVVPATKPDKRVFPKRSYMVLGGTLVGFVLFCGFAFFRDIWSEVIREDGGDAAV